MSGLRSRELACLAPVLLVLGAEVALVRVTAGRVAPADALVSLVLGTGGVFLLLGLARLLDDARAATLHVLAAGLPILVVSLGTVVPVLERSVGTWSALTATGLGVGWLVYGVRRVRERAALPSAGEGLLVWLACVLVAWAASGVGVPPPGMLGGLLAWGAFFAWLAWERGRAFAAPTIAAAAVAWPATIGLAPVAPIEAAGHGTPDVVLRSVDTPREQAGRAQRFGLPRVMDEGGVGTAQPVFAALALRFAGSVEVASVDARALRVPENAVD